MRVRALEEILPGELVLAVDPTPARSVNPGWHRRLHFHTGRTLNDQALRAEQEGRAGRLATAGQYLAPGVVQGLDAELVQGSAPGEWWLEIAPGIGLGVDGEDVVLARPLRVRLAGDEEIVLAPTPEEVDEGEIVVDVEEGNGQPDAGDDAIEVEAAPPAIRRRSLDALRAEGYFGEDGPEVYIAVLEPVVLQVTDGDRNAPFDPCEQDPEAYAFEDQQRVDGLRLLLYAWPSDLLGAPPGGRRWRNVLAWRIFEAERRLAPGELLPWETFGIPVALLGLRPPAQNRSAVFLDRAAVVRAGGAMAPRRPLVEQAGTPRLWQARFEQTVEHIATLDGATLRADGLDHHFRFLPPVGLLPPDAADVRGPEPAPDDPLDPPEGNGVDFLPDLAVFPAGFRITAAPVQLEALDDLIAASAPLEHLDLARNEEIQVLVPVPQGWFDPRLLIVERVPRAFGNAIRQGERTRDGWRVRQRLLWNGLAEARRRLEGEAPALPAGYLDDAALAAAREALGDEAPTLQEGEDFEAQCDTAVEALRSRLIELLSDAGQADAPGLQRLFRSMLPENDPRREADVLDPVEENFFGGLDLFIRTLKEKIARADDESELGWYRLRTDLFRMRAMLTGSQVATRLATSAAFGEIGATSIRPTTDDLAAFQAGLTETAGIAVEKDVPAPRYEGTGFGLRSLRERQPSPDDFRAAAPHRRLPGVRPAPDLPPDVAVREDIRRGLPQTTVAFDEPITTRLTVSPSVEATLSAQNAKADVLTTARNIHASGLDFTGVSFPVAQPRPGDGGQGGEVGSRNVDELDDATIRRIRTGDLDPAQGADEASFFAAGVRAMEHSVAGLRNIEAQVERYRAALEAAEAARVALRGIGREAEALLDQAADALTEILHDLDVAQALLEEERARLRAINRRRRAIIDHHVPYLVYRRPRTREALHALPVRVVEPGAFRDPLPECIASTFEAPPPLRAMVDLLREAPVTWLPALSGLVDRINRLDGLQVLLRHARQKALAPPAPAIEPLAVAAFADLRGLRIKSFVQAQTQVLRDLRVEAGHLAIEQLASWRRARDEAARVTTVGDLIDARHGRQDVARAATQALEEIYRVSACLYTRFREVPPVRRLAWADDVSQYDDTVDLRDLSVLEGWPEAGDVLERREMQALVDWLYGRIDANQPRAVTLMHELVRVALLLASHAPVHQLVSVELVTPQRAHVGSRLQLHVDVTRLRIGMHVDLQLQSAGPAVARGVVDDLGDGRATVKVLRNDGSDPLVRHATLVEPDRRGFTLTAGGLLGR